MGVYLLQNVFSDLPTSYLIIELIKGMKSLIVPASVCQLCIWDYNNKNWFWPNLFQLLKDWNYLVVFYFKNLSQSYKKIAANLLTLFCKLDAFIAMQKSVYNIEEV